MNRKIGVGHCSEKLEKPFQSAYIMINLSDPSSFASAFREISFMENVLFCDATCGEHDLICLLQAENLQEIHKIIKDRIAEVKGVCRIDVAVVRKTADSISENFNNKPDANGNPRSLSSYVLVETCKEKFESIYPTLCETKCIARCNATEGSFDFVLLAQAETFDEIYRTIIEKIQPRHEVIRIKECPIIDMFEKDPGPEETETDKKNVSPRGALPSFKIDLWKYRGEKGALIPLLQSAQSTFGYISEKAINLISRVTGIAQSEIYGVITFYAQFRLKPPGKYIIRVCNGTACHVNGAREIGNILIDELGIAYEETTDDSLFTLQSVACLGCCSLAPVMVINEETYGSLTPEKTRTILRDYRRREKTGPTAGQIQRPSQEL